MMLRRGRVHAGTGMASCYLMVVYRAKPCRLGGRHGQPGTIDHGLPRAKHLGGIGPIGAPSTRHRDTVGGRFGAISPGKGLHFVHIWGTNRRGGGHHFGGRVEAAI